MLVSNGNAAALQEPLSGIDAALQAAGEGWKVHPIGKPATVATDDPAAVRALWAHDPGAGVSMAGMGLEGLQRQAMLGSRAVLSVAEMARMAGNLEPVEREQILQMLKNLHGVSLRVLRASAAGDGKDDDLTLARQLIATIGLENILHTRGSFWLWDGGGVWRRCDDLAIQQRAQAVIEASHVNVTGSKVASVTACARNELFRSDHTFNLGGPDVVNCLNGELELSGGVWSSHPHRREMFRTVQLPVHYHPDSAAPRWEQFLREVFRDDPDREAKAQSLEELIGYTLQPNARHEKFVLLIGPGGNGKSKVFDVLSALCGLANVAGVQPHEFSNKFQRAQLDGKLANVVTELEQGAVMADAELKAITSGELTTVEHKFGTPFEMRAFATCWFGTNHLPHTRDFSDALFRRATVLQFNRTFAPHEQDPDLTAKLLSELPAILCRALIAYRHAVLNGFTVAPSSEAAKQAWRLEADQVAQFVQDRCKAVPAGRIEMGELYRHFENWARASGVRRIVGKRQFGDRLERLGFKRERSDGTKISGLIVIEIM